MLSMHKTSSDIHRLIERRIGRPLESGAVLADQPDLDSLSLVELGMWIESKFGISISDGAAEGMRTLDDLIDYVDARLARADELAGA
jgi:acyl carrier protein